MVLELTVYCPYSVMLNTVIETASLPFSKLACP